MLTTEDEWRHLRFEAQRIFTPSTPITTAELFAGRQLQIGKLLDTIGERGRHAIIYGEPGVGKTSIAQILKALVPGTDARVTYVRKPAFSYDTFSSIWMNIFKDIRFEADIGEGYKSYDMSQMYPDGVTPSDVVRELGAMFNDADLPIIVIDEYNVIKDQNISLQMAELIKAASDASVNATIIIVGISDSVVNLVSGHASIIRCSEEILMPRMNVEELQELLLTRFDKLGIKIDDPALWKITNLSKGLPAFAHTLGRGSAQSAIDRRMLNITEKDVDIAIGWLLESSQNTLKDDYEVATRSNQDKARYKQILTACALARSDESGYFIPRQVQDPLAAILMKPIGIDGFNRNLRELTDDKRGSILQSKGTERIYRYRFRNPAMQPFVIMKGIQEGFLDESARMALSAPIEE